MIGFASKRLFRLSKQNGLCNCLREPRSWFISFQIELKFQEIEKYEKNNDINVRRRLKNCLNRLRSGYECCCCSCYGWCSAAAALLLLLCSCCSTAESTFLCSMLYGSHANAVNRRHRGKNISGWSGRTRCKPKTGIVRISFFLLSSKIWTSPRKNVNVSPTSNVLRSLARGKVADISLSHAKR